MATFETLSLPQIYAAAEQIKGARKQSRLDDLREIATRQQIDQDKTSFSQGQEDRERTLGLEKAKQVDAKAGNILQATDAKAYIAKNEPDLVKHLGSIGIDFNTADEATVRQTVEAMRNHAREALGINRTPQSAQGKIAADASEGLLTKEQADNALATGSSAAPSSVREFQFARADGYKGSFKDWVTEGGQSSRPSSVQEWDFYNNLPEDMKTRYLEMKRNPNMKVTDVGGVPTVVAPTVVGGTSQTPLSTLQTETGAAGEKASATAQGTAKGSATAQAQINLPQSRESARYMTELLEKAKTHPGLPAAIGVKGVTNYLPGTDAADFKALKAQIGGKQFLQAYETLKGGGAITEIEGNKAEQAIARMDAAQTEKSFLAALDEFQGIVQRGLKIAEQKAGASQGAVPTVTAPVQVTSAVEAMKLPPGTVFITPDGRQKVRP